MATLVFCPVWGSESLPFDEFCRRVKDEGYDGVEMSLPTDEKLRHARLETIETHGLKLIAQHWETMDRDFGSHKEAYRRRLQNLLSGKPLFVSSQTGRDFFSFEQNEELIRMSFDVCGEAGIPIVHETHRSKFSFAAHIAQVFLEKIPELRLTLDISHWCCVAETLLDDQGEAVELAISRTEHIHARVGFAEGPQIPDPRTPEWETTLATYLGWWDRIVELRRAAGKDVTITAEFGPFPYMTMQPFTGMPISDQWAINAYMRRLLADRYR